MSLHLVLQDDEDGLQALDHKLVQLVVRVHLGTVINILRYKYLSYPFLFFCFNLPFNLFFSDYTIALL